MAEPILMIALSPTMNDGVIAQWLAKEGQAIKPGDALCEVETDKATMTYESPAAGTLLAIVKPAGGAARVGEMIAVLGKPGEDWSALAAAVPPVETPAPAANAASFPELQAAPPAQAGAPAASAAPEPPLGRQALPFSESREAPAGGGPSSPAAYPPSSPLARKLARERNVDLRGIRGSGPAGRVVARDIPGSAAAAATPLSRTEASPAAAGGGLRDGRVPLSRMRAIIAKRLSESYSDAPHFFVRAAVDMERLLDLRAAVNAGRERNLGLNAFVMKLLATALERHPVVNSSWEGDAIRYLPSADLGLAVALDGGLLTPVVRSCEKKGIGQIDGELADLVSRARSGGLNPDEYSAASFTISNLGSSGIEEFTAIINPPGSAILALGAISPEAVVRDGAIVARRTMRMTLSCDHRVIDGAVAAAFIADLKGLLEEPAGALL